MGIVKNIVTVLYIILCVALIILATIQAKDSQGASGAITGSTTNNFYEKKYTNSLSYLFQCSYISKL